MGHWATLAGLLLITSVYTCHGLNCMECTDVPSPVVCNQVVTCRDDSNCLLRQYITTSGAILYSSGCQSKKSCSEMKKRGVEEDRMGFSEAEDFGKDIVTCQECCDHEYCNIEGCGKKAIDRGNRGPYCFVCGVENDVYGCRNTKLCDAGYSCSIQTSSYPGMYATKCIPDTDCPGAYVKDFRTVPALVGKRDSPGLTVALPYCCKDDFCNDIRKFVNNGSLSVDGSWSSWSGWGSCSRTCGYGGNQSRTRSCDNPPPQNNGAACAGNKLETRNCLVSECPVDGGWSSWGHWSACTNSCGLDGQQTRSRTCDNPVPLHNGVFCQGVYKETRTCVNVSCSVDGAWSTWGPWEKCSGTCGTHIQSRNRSCDQPAPEHNGVDCIGNRKDVRACSHALECPVDGHWSDWTQWSSCSASCGQDGWREKHRTCSNPAPAHGGQHCIGFLSREIISCNKHPCPVDGQWTEWGLWSSCSRTCGHSWTRRHRTCTKPAPTHGGADCPGSHNDYNWHRCNVTACPVDGQWTNWGSWSSCTHTCGHGWIHKVRTCSNPAPAHGGSGCHGLHVDWHACSNITECPVDGNWTEWTTWSSCSHTCGHTGVVQRHRYCTNPAPAHGGDTCHGDYNQVHGCSNVTECPVDGQWTGWTSWSSCSHTCGHRGHIWRHRSCTSPAPANGGDKCPGSYQQVHGCRNVTECPVDGQWTEWTPWSSCSHTCGHHGIVQRHRSCTNPAPAHGGDTCHGGYQQVHGCSNVTDCPIIATHLKVDGHWSDWEVWGACTVTCGVGGHVKRIRHCNNPFPLHGGTHCPGSFVDSGPCPTHIVCPGDDPLNTTNTEISTNDHEAAANKDGNWSDWGQWSACSSTCGSSGTQHRERQCSNPPPSHGGDQCQGHPRETSDCPAQPMCPGDFCRSNAGYVYIQGGHNHLCMKLYHDKKTWNEAQGVCRHHGGDLMTMKTDPVIDAVNRYFKPRTDNEDRVWIGLHGRDHNDHHHPGWSWINSTAHFGSHRFDEHNFHMAHADTCAFVQHWGHWLARACHEKYAFLCEIPV